MKTLETVTGSQLESYAPRIIALGLLGILLLFSLTGCQTAATAQASLPIAREYTLVSVNGKDVPCDLSHEGVTMTVKSGAFTFNADGTCRSLSVFAVPPHKDIHREVKATYVRTGPDLTMRWERVGVTTGQFSDNEQQFTMNNEGMIFCYQKQAGQ